LLTEILSDQQLIDLYNEGGYLISVDYPKQEIKFHTIDCMLADPISTVGVKPSKAKESQCGEVWYSKERDEVLDKADKIVKEEGYTLEICAICDR
jgi:hypothetical protein